MTGRTRQGLRKKEYGVDGKLIKGIMLEVEKVLEQLT